MALSSASAPSSAGTIPQARQTFHHPVRAPVGYRLQTSTRMGLAAVICCYLWTPWLPVRSSA